jgi:hypothetical protein
MKPVCDIGKKPSDQTTEWSKWEASAGSFQPKEANLGEGPHILGLEADLIA